MDFIFGGTSLRPALPYSPPSHPKSHTNDRWIFSLFEMEAYFEKKHFISFNFQGTNWTREPDAKFGGFFFVPHNLLENGVTSQISLAVDKKRPKMSNRQLAIFFKFHRWQFWSWSSEIHSLAISTGQKVRKSGHVINLKSARTYNPKEKFQATDLWYNLEFSQRGQYSSIN